MKWEHNTWHDGDSQRDPLLGRNVTHSHFICCWQCANVNSYNWNQFIFIWMHPTYYWIDTYLSQKHKEVWILYIVGLTFAGISYSDRFCKLEIRRLSNRAFVISPDTQWNSHHSSDFYQLIIIMHSGLPWDRYLWEKSNNDWIW